MLYELLISLNGNVQVPEVENCLYELLSDRERHLKAMENLLMTVRRHEVEAERASHNLKGVKVRLECTEQDKASLEKRFREEAEVHRTDRARWFVLKQVSRLKLSMGMCIPAPEKRRFNRNCILCLWAKTF